MVKITVRHVVAAFAVWCAAIYAIFAILVLGGGDIKAKAELGMVSGLLLFWVVIGGAAMYLLRDHVRAMFRKVPGDWRLKFFLFCVLLALVEEAVTTAMTNLGPFFGVKLMEVAITASADYFEVVTRHSVIVFLPMFAAWALLLWRYRFSPASVFLLWGITGAFCESVAFGFQNLIIAGFWTFVYGLMMYLPAFSIPQDRNARLPKWYHYPLAVLASFAALVPVFIVAVIVLAIVQHV